MQTLKRPQGDGRSLPAVRPSKSVGSTKAIATGRRRSPNKSLHVHSNGFRRRARWCHAVDRPQQSFALHVSAGFAAFEAWAECDVADSILTFGPVGSRYAASCF